MDESDALSALGALAQETRLRAFRTLVASEPRGVAAGELARLLGVPQNTMSSHLSTLAQAGLVAARRSGRSVVYRADIARLHALVLFLARDCCGGRPDLCAPLVEALSPCCSTGDRVHG